jgi:urea transport system permease protein
MPPLRVLLVALIGLACCAVHAPAADDAELHSILTTLASDDVAVRKEAIIRLGASRDARLLPFLADYARGSAYRWADRVVIAPEMVESLAGDKAARILDPLSRAQVGSGPVPASELTPLEAGRRERIAVRDATTRLRLFVPSRDDRLSAVTRLGDGEDASAAIALGGVLADERDPAVRRAAEEGLYLLRLLDADPAKTGWRREAIVALGALGSARSLPKLEAVLAGKPDAETAADATAAIARIQSWQSTVRGVGHAFSGLSLGSVLILMALGLAIIFGLMGVINMAHGELVMIGAYATFVTQKAFEIWLPGAWFPFYFLAAIPVSFAVAALVGWIIEQAVVRWLYGRPLETLLATYGVSLLLVQSVRTVFGDNCAVNSPAWLQGGVEVANGLVLPWARIFILGFCAAAVTGLVLLIGRTRIGLLLRATTQNRPMAAALGVGTRRIDGWAFALGSGIAGIAGCALTLISNITPNMGQELVVDSFLVVVVGGVGKLAGAVIAGLGLGSLTKLFEPWTQAVWAKVLVLFCVIAFIQWKPSGLFPQKGRMADA